MEVNSKLIMADCNDSSDWYSWIGRRVCAKDNLYGTLKYFGNTQFSHGLWCGIELDNPLGKNDGMVNSVRYFTCSSNFGIFVPASKVTKLKDFPEGNLGNITNLNETFKIENSFKKQEVDSNSVILASKTVGEKVSNSGLGSTESLGILSSDIFDQDNSWDDFKLNCSLYDEFPNNQNIKENNSSSLSEATSLLEKDLHNTIANPKYASTPRVPKKKVVGYENDLDDSLYAKNHLIDKFTFDMHCQKTSEFFFDVDKLKSNPNLTSTYKNLSELTTILNNPELSPILLGNNIQQSVNLGNSKDFSNKEKFSQNSNEILCKTFELHNTTCSPTSSEKECEKKFNKKDELNVTTIIQDIKSISFEDKKLNTNATFEFQCPSNTTLNLCFEEIKDLTFDLKENATRNFNNCASNKNELNTSSLLENINGNATFKLKSPIPVQQKIPDEETKKKTFDSKEFKIENPSNFNECEAITVVTNKNALLLEKTFVFDLSTINECENSEIQNEFFSCKDEFLKETDLSQNNSTHLNYRNSICLPPSFCNQLQKSVRRISSVSSYPSYRGKEKGLEGKTEHKSLKNRSSISSLKDLHEKANVFKKPFSPNSALRNSKSVLKSHSSVNSKENKNKTSNKESNKFPKRTFFTDTKNKSSITTECKKNEMMKSYFNKEKSEFSTLKSCNSKNSSSKTGSSLALPFKNKLSCDNIKQSSGNASKFYSKTIPVNKVTKNGIQTSTVSKIAHKESVKEVVKNSKSQLKMQGLDNTFISKNDYCEPLQKSNFPASNFSNKPRIPKRNSLVPCFKDKLPVGVIKPRYSMHQAKNDAILEYEEKKKSCQSSKVTEKINLQSNGEIRNSFKDCSEANSIKNCSNLRELTGLPKKIKSQIHSPSNQKPGLIQPLKKVRGIPIGLKIPRFSQDLKKF